VDSLARYLVYGLGWYLDWKGARSTEYAMVGTRCTTWACGRLGKVARVRIGIVNGLERCPESGLGRGRYPACRLGMWMTWKGILCTEWDCGWFRKVPGVWFG
jgi:hypothetical protein